MYTPPSIEGDHVVITGPITGFVTLEDGTRIDVSQPHIVAASQDQAVEVAHLIGLHWAAPENVHPGQIDVGEDGEVTVNDFVYDDTNHQAYQEQRDA